MTSTTTTAVSGLLPVRGVSFCALESQYRQELRRLHTIIAQADGAPPERSMRRYVETDTLLLKLRSLHQKYRTAASADDTAHSRRRAFTPRDLQDLCLLGFNITHLDSGVARDNLETPASGTRYRVTASKDESGLLQDLVQENNLLRLRLAQLSPSTPGASSPPEIAPPRTPAAGATPSPSGPPRPPSHSPAVFSRPPLHCSPRVIAILTALEQHGTMPDLSLLERDELVELKLATARLRARAC